MSVLIAGDMSQLEIRIAAALSKDPAMIQILREGRDMHRVTAAALYGVKEDDVTAPQRARSKTGNYLVAYGGKENKLIEGMEKIVLERPEDGLTVPTMEEAREFFRVHRKLYSRYWQWTYWTISRARGNGYSDTAFSRPRFLPDLHSYDDGLRSEAERQVVSHAISGTGADLMKMAMIRVAEDPWMSEAGYMTLQVHDEIVSIVHRDEDAPEYGARLDRYMQCGQPFLPDVKLVVDVGYGSNWKDTHK